MIGRLTRLLIVAIGVAACRDTNGQPRVPRDLPLRDVTSPGRLSEGELSEPSGLVRSPRHANVFWSHGDSGNDERLFAFDSSGQALGAARVDRATNKDWEALAAGPCPEGTCLYIGDVGDNMARRDEVTIYRIPEPSPSDTATAPADGLTFRYPDGATDVEAIWVTPDTSVFLLTKRPERDGARWRAARVYRLPPAAWQTGATATAELVDSLPIVPKRGEPRGWITDAALSDSDSAGTRRLAVRTYGLLYLFDIDAVTWRPTSLVGKCSLDGLPEKQRGEGLTWLEDGRLLFNHEGVRERMFAGRCP